MDGVAFYHLILAEKKQETFFRFPAPVSYTHLDVYKRQVIGSREKDNVAGLCLGGGNDSALVINALRRGTGQVVDAAGRVHPADKARTVKGGGRAEMCIRDRLSPQRSCVLRQLQTRPYPAKAPK